MKRFIQCSGVILAMTAAVASAQAKLGVYGGVGAEKSGLIGEGWKVAETVGAYYGMRGAGPVALAIDGRAVLSSNVNSFLVGPRVVVHLPLIPMKPYGEVLVGGTFFATQNNGKKDSSDFAYRFVGGFDSTIFYHLDWRVLEFSYGGGLTELNRSVHQENLSTGLVLRF
jgi:hypothetical protein